MKDAAVAPTNAANSGRADDPRRSWELTQHAKAHDGAENRGARVERLGMAARLSCRLVARRSPTSRNMTEAAAAYAGDGGFADRARKCRPRLPTHLPIHSSVSWASFITQSTPGLPGSDQMELAWSTEMLRPLPALLRFDGS
jgi:hypothetical protein